MYLCATPALLYKVLYIIYIPLLLTEWAVDLVSKIWSSFHESIKDMTLALENKINATNELVKPKPSKES